MAKTHCTFITCRGLDVCTLDCICHTDPLNSCCDGCLVEMGRDDTPERTSSQRRRERMRKAYEDSKRWQKPLWGINE